MSKSCSEQFRLSNLKLTHENRRTFITSEWQFDKNRPSIIYLLIRLVLFVPFFAIWLLTLTALKGDARRKQPIYLTYWGFTLCLLQSFVSCIMLTVAVVEDRMHYKFYWTMLVLKLYSLYWMLSTVATVLAFVITSIYWPIIYPAEHWTYWSTLNFMMHGYNSISMFFDLWIVSHPVRLLHCVYPLLTALTYIIMTVIYYAAGGTTPNGSRYIYPILKWDEPGVTLGYCLAVVILMIIVHIFTYYMYKLRVMIVPRIVAVLKKKMLGEAYDEETV